MKLTVNQILDLKPDHVETEWIDLEFMTQIYPNLVEGSSIYQELSQNMINSLKEVNYVHDTCNDNRSRALKILFRDNYPIAVYQYTGKGYFENVHVLDRERLDQVYLDWVKNTMGDREELGMDQEIEILTYGAEIEINEDQILIAFQKKTV